MIAVGWYRIAVSIIGDRAEPTVIKILDQVLGLPAIVVYLIVGSLVFAEDAMLLGFVVPGETAAVLGGVAASRGHVSLALMCGVATVAAIIGDSVGYTVGLHFGGRLLSMRPLRRRERRIDAVRATLARSGGPAVFLGRFVAFVRSAMPFLAGTSRMRYSRFLAYDAAACLVWSVGSVLLGYLAGGSYAAVERTFGRATALLFAAAAAIGAIGWYIRQHRRGYHRADMDSA